MVLTLEQIKQMTHGTERIEERDGMLRFFRFSALEEDAYSKHPRAAEFFKRTFDTTCVVWSFYTDSKSLSFDYKADKAGNHLFDLYENGAMTRHIVCDTKYQMSGRFCIPLSEGEKLVEFHFPRDTYLPIANVALDDGASFKPAQRKYKMLAYGDSITHGSSSAFHSYSYVSHLAQLLDADVTNKGIGGDEYFPSLISEPLSVTPDWITVAYGTNDWKHCTPEQFRAKCEPFLTKLSALYSDKPIFVITPSWRADAEIETPFGAPAYTVDAFVREIAAPLANVTVLSAWNLVPHVKDFFADSRLHPNNMGFGIYSANLYKAILPLLIKKIGYEI